MPITVSWEVDNYEVINVLGELQTEALKGRGDNRSDYRETEIWRRGADL